MGHSISALVARYPIDMHAAALLDLPVVIESGFAIIALNNYHSDFWSNRLGVENSSMSKIFHDSKLTLEFARRLGIKRFALIQTEYFGGIGEQFATVYNDGDRVSQVTEGSINEALNLIGVSEGNGFDAFDTLELGKYRDFSDRFDDYTDDVETPANITHRIFSVSEACHFILDWEQIDTPMPGKPLPPIAHAAAPIIDLNNLLGYLWVSDKHPLRAAMNSPSHLLSLFEFQDTILSPHEYEAGQNNDGIVCFAAENQGVWVMGFDPQDPVKLWVMRDWWDYSTISQQRDQPSIQEKWRRTETTIEEAVIFLLLSNFSIMRSTDKSWDFDLDGVPQDANKLLWRSAEYPSVAFWTNAEHTALHYEGNYLTIRR